MSEGEREEMLDGETTVAWIARDMVEAQIAEAALQDAGISCIVEDFSVNPYDGVWVPQRGWGRILVQEQDVERAKEIIEGALESRPLGDEDANTEK